MTGLIGRRLGQYEITALIGRGGMATVYAARQQTVERDVAIKVIQVDAADPKEFAKRFNREAKTIASLSHPHILKLYDYGQQDDIAYLVMELHRRGSLDRWLRDNLPSLDTIAQIFDQLGSALTAAHQQGIIHRDLKPQNILLDAHDNAILTDFGIAKLLDETTTVTKEGLLLGTPAYMAPEQWRGEPITQLVDIYAMGIILFELLAGHVPYTGDTPSVIMYQHLQAIPPSIAALRQDLFPEVDLIIQKALHKEPSQRFQSAAELAAAFRAVLAQKPIAINRMTGDLITTSVGSQMPTLHTLEPNTPTSVSRQVVISEAVIEPTRPKKKGGIQAPISLFAGAALLCFLVTASLSILFMLRMVQTRSGEVVGIGLVAGLGGLIGALAILGLYRVQRLHQAIPLIGEILLLALVGFGSPLLTNGVTDNLIIRAQQSVTNSQSRQTSDLLSTLATLSPDRARNLIAKFNDDGVTAIASNNLTLAHSYLEAIRTFDSDDTIDVGRDKTSKSVSRYNLGELREAESDISGAITTYQEAIGLDDSNLDARYAVSSLLLINQPQDQNALNTAITIANLGWKNYIPDSYCHGPQNLQDSATFQKTWYCFALKTTEAGARLNRNDAQNGDTSPVIESLARSAVNLAGDNGNFRAEGYFTAEAYYYLGKVAAPATADVLCGILANLDGTNPRHRLWADYANQQLAARHMTCDQ